MSQLLSKTDIEKYNKDGAIFLKNKFDIKWIENLKKGIEKDIKFCYLWASNNNHLLMDPKSVGVNQ